MKIGEWIARLGEVWVEGQIAQLTRRPGVSTQFLDAARPRREHLADRHLPARASSPTRIVEGSRVVLRARPDFYLERGTLSLRATEIRQVGLGELLARLERSSGCSPPRGCSPPTASGALPFLPRRIGLITGRASAAERDVVENARRRLPGVAVPHRERGDPGRRPRSTRSSRPLQRLDRDPEVDVIVIARGGGSVEDLLPFSNETLVRAVSAAADPGGQRDRPRDRRAAARPRRRPRRLDADRRGQAASCPTWPTSCARSPSCAQRGPRRDPPPPRPRGRADGRAARADARRGARAGSPASAPTADALRDRARRRLAGAARRGARRPRARPRPGRARCRRRPPSTAATPSCAARDGAVVRDAGRGARHAAHPGRARRVRRRRPVGSQRCPSRVTEPSYEAARAELREIVAKLESGGQSLEESLALWERGEELADICQRWLDGAGARPRQGDRRARRRRS